MADLRTYKEIASFAEICLSEDLTIPCDSLMIDVATNETVSRCDSAAEWAMYLKGNPECSRCTGGVMLKCTACKDDRMLNRIPLVVCRLCRTVYTPPSTHYLRVEPLS